MLDRILNSKKLQSAAEKLAPGKTVRFGGVWGSSAAMIGGALGRITGRPILFVTTHLDDADALADDIELFTGRAAQIFPAWELEVGSEHVSDDIIGERMRICTLLAEPIEARDEPVDILIAPVVALLQPVPTPRALAEARLSLRLGAEIPPEEIISWLVDSGFEQVDQVDKPNEFARRGGIVDVFPTGVGQAIRVEFFGDQIDSIRKFDLDTQRSTDKIQAFDLTGTAAGRRTDPNETTHLGAYLGDQTIICTAEPQAVHELAGDVYRRLGEKANDDRQMVSRRMGIDTGDSGLGMFEPKTVFDSLESFAAAEMYAFGAAGDDSEPMAIRSIEKLALNTQEALGELEELSQVADVWVYCENTAERDRFGELLASSHKELGQRVNMGIGHLAGGFYWPEQKLVAVGHHEIFHRFAKVRRIRRMRTGRPIDSLLDLQAGDYVVHISHGIAKFEGLRHIDRDGVSEEYLSLKFADNATMHVPTAHINLVQKYVGTRHSKPALSKLGGRLWTRQKDRAMAAVRDLAADMIRTQAMRQAIEGFSYPDASAWQQQFTDEFLYTETEDQITTMQQIDSDLLSKRPMDRLVCGDVGYGKTELAMRAAFKVAEAGRQVAVLSPTTVLADQHFRTFTERFADYPFEIDVISRFRTAGEQRKLLKRLVLGNVDILIGTHRMLSEDVRFANLGLLVIDEEQRFGVEHKERLKSTRASVDVMTLTATPIPRTLHMALLGLRDISSLTTPPMDRRSIHTEVCQYDPSLIRWAIQRELARGGQVFFVHNRVGNIHAVADRVRELAPDARVDVGHGRMHEHEMERAMLRFVAHETDVLVCTTIIESGLDIPSANTMIICDCDRFGLSALHQLRGRVGRYKHRAYCYMLLGENRSVSPIAAKRLKAIEEFSDLGAGFQIAMRDLEIRGAGNILGQEQSGHIAAIGYELYCQLLEGAVTDLRGESKVAAPSQPAHIELGIGTYIPRAYIPSQRQRMEAYRRLAACDSGKQLQQIRTDLADVYGRVPDEVEQLLDMTEARALAGRLGIESLVLIKGDLVFTVRDMTAARRVFDGASGTVRMPDNNTVHWRLRPPYLQMPTLMRIILKQLRQATAAV
ncbi:MAG: transcription-repair coupling factor [Phycisphaerae bacterium]|jgi:transcription-repair coupling factor (superfamily II helicase)|nr:transcription-repair coupling factor [Phycisphaerae bacterium]